MLWHSEGETNIKCVIIGWVNKGTVIANWIEQVQWSIWLASKMIIVEVWGRQIISVNHMLIDLYYFIYQWRIIMRRDLYKHTLHIIQKFATRLTIYSLAHKRRIKQISKNMSTGQPIIRRVLKPCLQQKKIFSCSFGKYSWNYWMAYVRTSIEPKR